MVALHNNLELFVGGCRLCEKMLKMLEVGKCSECILTIFDMNNLDEEGQAKAKDYGVRAVPTLVINGKIRLVGVPTFTLFCSPETYRFLEQHYSIR